MTRPPGTTLLELLPPNRGTEPQGGILSLVGEDLRDRAGVRYTELRAKSVLNRCDTPRMPDCWTINPYRGCSFGCRYCYARYTHEFLGIKDPVAFERWIFVKVGAAAALEGEATERKLRARPIAIGTATDPYQPAEARYGLTRGVLDVLVRYRGLRISITTKSALVVRDLELLKRIHERSSLSINVSLITIDRGLARQLDPGAPTPARRLRTVQVLAGAGLKVGLNLMPILPGINDGESEIRRLFLAAKSSGVSWVTAAPLFLASQSRRHFLAWLRTNMPDRLPLYRRLYADGIDVDPAWRRELRERVGRIREEIGLPESPFRRGTGEPSASPQLGLPGIEERPAIRCGREGPPLGGTGATGAAAES